MRVGGEGIVKRDEPVLAVAKIAEIAVPHGDGRHAVLIGGVGPLAQTFPGNEEEGPVLAVVDFRNPDRAAHRESELVAVQVRRFGEGVLPAAGDADAAVAIGFEQRAVEFVRAALAAEEDGHRPGELRRGVIGLDVHLFERVQAGHTAEVPSLPDLVDRSAVEQRAAGVGAHPIRLHETGGIDAGHGGEERLVVPAVHRKLLDALPLERVPQGQGWR